MGSEMCIRESLYAHLAFPGGAEEPSPTSCVEYRNDAATGANELVSRNLFDLEAFRRRCDVVEGDVVRWGFDRRGFEDVGGVAGRKVLWYVIGAVRVPAGLASNHGGAEFGVASR